MRRARAIVVALGLIPALVAAEPLTVRDAWVREAPPGVEVMAGYFTIDNAGDEDRAVVSARSPCCATVTLHRSVVEGGTSRMVRQERVPVPAGGRARFAPGGLHLMLMSPREALRAGDRVEIVLELDAGDPVRFDAPVRRVPPE